MSNFVKQIFFDVDYAPTSATKYVSQKTGLQVILIEQQSPLIQGYVTVSTEITNDSGCPHTLEHIVFTGSKKYPQPGLLDALANRSFSMVGAWTGTDHTAFSLLSAGWEGFRTLLPVYLEHVLNPTITDEACLTEVYHIDGEGKEKGVVFSEMQGLGSLTHFTKRLAVRRMIFEEGSPYRSETGGVLENLRSLTWDEIREFHKSMYRPDNVCVLIAGSIDEEDLLNVMQEFDESLPELPAIPNRRPFSDVTMSSLGTSVVERVEFPDTDETRGEVFMAWVGPHISDTLTNLAICILESFFTNSSISLFKKNLVEIENPIATQVEFSSEQFKNKLLGIDISGVPIDKIDEVEPIIKGLLKEQSQPEIFDLDMIKVTLAQQKLEKLFMCEGSAAHYLLAAMDDFIGGSDGTSFVENVKDLSYYDTLNAWEAKDWCEVIDKWFVRNPSATALVVPSAKLFDCKKESDKAIDEQIKVQYGEDGLKQLGEELEVALKKNKEKIPDAIMDSFPRPDPSKISFIKTKSYKAGSNKFEHESYISDDELALRLKDDTPSDIPLYFHIEDFKSQFLTVHLLASSFSVPVQLKPYLSIIDLILSSSLTLPSGEIISEEQVTVELKTDLIEYDIVDSFDREFLEIVNMRFKIEKENYNKAIQWFGKLINYSTFSESKLKSAIEKIVNGIPELKREGYSVVSSLQKRTLLSPESQQVAKDIVENEGFFRECLKRIEKGQFDEIAKELYEVKRLLFATDNLRIVLIGDASQIPKPISSWSTFIDTYDNVSTRQLSSVPNSFEVLSEKGKSMKNEAFLTTYTSSNSAYIISCTSIPADYSHMDIAKIDLALQVLTVMDGWKEVRGAGLAYGVKMSSTVEEGVLKFVLSEAADGIEAFKRVKDTVDNLTQGTGLTQSVITDAISVLINRLVLGQSNFIAAAGCNFMDNILKNRGPDYNTNYLKQLGEVTVDDIKSVMKKYFQPLFDSNGSIFFACVHPSRVDSMKTFLEGNGYRISVDTIVEADYMEL